MPRLANVGSFREIAAAWSGVHDSCLPALALLSVTAFVACAPAHSSDGVALNPGAEELVDSAQIATAPQRRQQVMFDWSLTDRDARFSGKGVVRVAPPYRARLDLFGPRDEAYVVAVLDGEELRLRPPAASELLPPAAFLWASLGVFRRPPQPLTAARHGAGELQLAFADEAERWRFEFGPGGLRQVEWQAQDGGRRTVEIEQDSLSLPLRGKYRDWVAFRELTLTVTEVENVDGFTSDIWNLDAH